MSIKQFDRNKYGVLERNRITPVSMESQCAIDETSFPDGAEVGSLVSVDKVNGLVKKTGGLIGLLVNSERLYYPTESGLCNYIVKPGEMASVLFLTKGEEFTTNTICYDDSEFTNMETIETAMVTATLAGTPIYGIAGEGPIKLTKTPTGAQVQAVALTDLPDGQEAIKFIVL